jgi:hypothetical protein
LGAVVADGLEGARLLGTSGGDLYVGPREGDAFAVALVETESGARAPFFVEAGESSSLGAILEVARQCDAMASAHHDAAAGTLGSVWGYPTVADLADLINVAAYNVQQLQQAAASCGGWPNDPAGWTVWQADLVKAFGDMNAATSAVNPVLTQTPAWLKNWRDLQDAGAMPLWDQVRAVIDETIDLDRRLRAAGACTAPTYAQEPQPTASDPDLWTYNVAGSALKGIKDAASNALGPVKIGLGGVVLGVGATLLGLFALSRFGVFGGGGGGRRAVASSPKRRSRWSDEMILEAIRDGHGLTGPAMDRAFELADAGFIDTRGTWRLTRKGQALLGEQSNAAGAPVYRTRYVHKISPSEKDVGPDVELDAEDLATRTTLAAALRRAGVMASGERLRDFRVESGGKIVAFPSKSIWHAIVLMPR